MTARDVKVLRQADGHLLAGQRTGSTVRQMAAARGSTSDSRIKKFWR